MAFLPGIFEDNLRNKVLESKIFLVGAGGIGCEILKNLVLSGFKEIEVIDLDTIDVSNLNRQFLFHKEHVGKSKAQVAKDSALTFNPNVNILAHHDSITNTNYGVNFFKKFSIVLNALDNKAARNHVNRMCLTADVPLIESGTAGYNGQVELIKKGLTQCYECQPKATEKSYPGCTIRNTPSEPIHCIVWAKHLFNQLFGEDNADQDVSPNTADPDAVGDAGEAALATESNEDGNVNRVNTKGWAKECDYDAEKLFNKFFHDDIKYLLSMSNLWKNRTPPQPTKWGDLSEVVNMQTVSSAALNSNVQRDQRVWNLQECGDVFQECLARLKIECKKLNEGDHMVWDKDDKYGMDFVAASANIRAHIFGISQKSRFEIKSLAGNIIPAIATTNAITAGFVVMHAFKVLQNQFDKCQSVYMRLTPNGRNQIMVPDKELTPPNPKCYVCAEKPEVIVQIDTERVNVLEFKNDVLIKALNMIEPDVMMDKGTIVISSEEGETDCNNEKKLSEMSIVDGCILRVDDFFQNYELSITIVHKNAERDEPVFHIIADPDTLKPKVDSEGNNTAAGASEPQPSTSNGTMSKITKVADNDDEDDLCIIDDVNEGASTSTSGTEGNSSKVQEKRKTDENEEGPSSKKAKIQNTNDEDDDDVIEID